MSEFAEGYPEARERFLEAVRAFETQTGRRCARQRHAIVEAEDLGVDVVHFEPAVRRRLYLVTSGVHGIEGYFGNAVQRALLAGPLQRLGDDCGVMLVHAVNPWGMAHFRRVNPENVDLNRNFEPQGEALYASENPGYRLIASALAPGEPCRGGLGARARLFGSLCSAVLRKGYPALKQALLQGQYDTPEGLFYGGSQPQREMRTFAEVFEPLCARYDEILLTDLHTGYGERGQVLLLWSHVDSREVIAYEGRGMRGAKGLAQTYVVTGDLVGWCRRTAKRINPGGTFDGLLVELGTTGLSVRSQFADLATMVRENQLHRHGARDQAVEHAVKASFREMFYPTDPAWRRQALAATLVAIENLLARRGYLRPA